MPQRLSEKFVVKRKPMGESDIIVKDRDDLNSSLDVSEFAYSNSELVNFENAAVNIDNSNDVILGPVTQFNVSGNVTIVQNGLQEDLINEKAIFEKITDNNFENGTKPWRKFFRKKKNMMLVLFCVCLLSLSTIFLLIILIITHPNNNASRDYPENSSHFITKAMWGGRMEVSAIKANVPVKIIVIKYTRGGFCVTSDQCAELTRKQQDQCFHQNLSDISYNFLIGGDGNIYVGRGWGVKNLQSPKFLDIALHGNYLFDTYYPNMINATQVVINEGVRQGFIDEDYFLTCHNQTDKSVGQEPKHLWDVVSKWGHFTTETFFDESMQT